MRSILRHRRDDGEPMRADCDRQSGCQREPFRYGPGGTSGRQSRLHTKRLNHRPSLWRRLSAVTQVPPKRKLIFGIR